MTGGLKMNSKERRDKVYTLREEGMTYREIGLQFGFSVERARQLYLLAKYERELLENPFASRISARARNGLVIRFMDEGILSDPGRVVKLGRDGLCKVKRLGPMSVEEISMALYDLGYIEDPDSW